MTHAEPVRADADDRPASRRRDGIRTATAAVLLTLILALVTGCGESESGATEVTCGEFADMTDEDRRDVVREILDDTLPQDEDFQDLKDLGQEDDGLDQIAIGIDLECAESSTSTTLRTITSE